MLGHRSKLAFPIPPAQVQLTEFVGMGGFRVVHAVPWMAATAKRLGLSGWPTRAFCGTPLRESDIGGGTRDPSAIGCRACLRAMRLAGVL